MTKRKTNLLGEIELTRSEPLNAAVIHLAIPRDEMQQEMPRAIDELLSVISAQKMVPAGPLFAHHLKLSEERFDFEAGFPVRSPIAEKGRVKPGALPEADVARSVYEGEYEGLFAAWEEFGARLESELGTQMKKRGLRPGETIWEHYLIGPETEPNPTKWRTELNQPLVEA